MIILNFISPTQKEANRFQKGYSLVKKIMLIFTVVLIISVGVLAATQILLQDKLEDITKATEAQKQYTVEEKPIDLEQTIKDFNRLLSNINTIQSEYTPWSKIFIETSSFVPDGIQISSLMMHKASAEFKFVGNANTRDDLLLLKKNLEESDIFTDIQSPISNLLSKENINFELSGKLKFETNSKTN